MKKSDLKTGMWAKIRNGSRMLVVKQCETFYFGHQDIMFIGDGEFSCGDEFTEELLNKRGDDEFDIIKILYAGHVSGLTLDVDSPTHSIIWTRKDETHEEAQRKKNPSPFKMGQLVLVSNDGVEWDSRVFVCNSPKVVNEIHTYDERHDLQQWAHCKALND